MRVLVRTEAGIDNLNVSYDWEWELRKQSVLMVGMCVKNETNVS